jgi:hypothetical protein
LPHFWPSACTRAAQPMPNTALLASLQRLIKSGAAISWVFSQRTAGPKLACMLHVERLCLCMPACSLCTVWIGGLSTSCACTLSLPCCSPPFVVASRPSLVCCRCWLAKRCAAVGISARAL